MIAPVVKVRLVSPPPPSEAELKKIEAQKLASALSAIVARTRQRMFATPPLTLPTDRERRLQFMWAEVRSRVKAYLVGVSHDGSPAESQDAEQVWVTFETCWAMMSKAEMPPPKTRRR